MNSTHTEYQFQIDPTQLDDEDIGDYFFGVENYYAAGSVQRCELEFKMVEEVRNITD